MTDNKNNICEDTNTTEETPAGKNPVYVFPVNNLDIAAPNNAQQQFFCAIEFCQRQKNYQM